MHFSKIIIYFWMFLSLTEFTYGFSSPPRKIMPLRAWEPVSNPPTAPAVQKIPTEAMPVQNNPAQDRVSSHPKTSEDSCKTSCTGSGTVKIDIQARCMCVSVDNCFKVDIGEDGPEMTTNGHGVLGVANGVKFCTKKYCSLDYDNDAISMGIEANSYYGKWIHKSDNCGPGGDANTWGCIGVPCKNWKDVKSQIGKSIDVCRGNNSATTKNSNSRSKFNKPAPGTK